MQQVQVSKVRRIRTLALSLAALLIGATFYAHNVRAADAVPQATLHAQSTQH